MPPLTVLVRLYRRISRARGKFFANFGEGLFIEGEHAEARRTQRLDSDVNAARPQPLVGGVVQRCPLGLQPLGQRGLALLLGELDGLVPDLAGSIELLSRGAGWLRAYPGWRRTDAE